MPETPDFEKIAQDAMLAMVTCGGRLAEERIFTEALRSVWNARGAADIAKVEAIMTTTAAGASVPSVMKNLDLALRTLDRK